MFDTLLIHPIINVLLVIYQLVHFLHVPWALGFSIILLTVVIRFLLYPLTASQLKTSRKMQTLAPHLSKLKERHKNDAKRMQQETMRLYQNHGINPAAGCLPVLLQFPLLWALYAVLQKVAGLKPAETLDAINKIAYVEQLRLREIWDTTFFGLPLGQNPSQLLNIYGVLIFLVPITTGVLQFIQAKMMFTAKPADDKEKNLPAGRQEKGDFASAFQAQSTYIFPLMIGFFSYTFPLGLSLYWNTYTVFGIIQQYKMQGWGGLKKPTFLGQKQIAEPVNKKTSLQARSDETRQAGKRKK